MPPSEVNATLAPNVADAAACIDYWDAQALRLSLWSEEACEHLRLFNAKDYKIASAQNYLVELHLEPTYPNAVALIEAVIRLKGLPLNGAVHGSGMAITRVVGVAGVAGPSGIAGPFGKVSRP